MIQSMTGFAAASAETPRGRLSVELRSVNARFLDLQFRIADELRALEPALRELVAARISRGKLDCRVFLNQASGATSGQLNSEALAQLRQLASQVQKEMPHAAPLRVADVLRWPGVMAQAPLDEGETRGLARLTGDLLVAQNAHAADDHGQEQKDHERNYEGCLERQSAGSAGQFSHVISPTAL